MKTEANHWVFINTCCIRYVSQFLIYCNWLWIKRENTRERNVCKRENGGNKRSVKEKRNVGNQIEAARERHRHPTNFTLASLSNDFRAI